MGLAVAGMHYTGMAAVTFVPGSMHHSAQSAVSVSSLGVFGVVLVTFMVLALSILTSRLDQWASRNVEAKRFSEERYRQLFSRSLAGMSQSTLDGQLIDCNDALARILGLASRGEVIGRFAHSLYVDAAQRDTWIRQLETERAVAGFEHQLKRANGDLVWVVESASIVDSSTDGQRIIEGTLIDISRQKRLETDLHQALKLESVGRLAAGVAHEINTPVQFVSDSLHFVREATADLTQLISTYRDALQAIATGTTADDAAGFVAEAKSKADLDYVLDNLPAALDRSLDGLNRVSVIVRSMKDFAHPDQTAMEDLDLNRAIESTLVVARNEFKYVADVDTDFGDLPLVKCHGGEINQVVLNIIVNAAHAIADIVRDTTARGRITIKTRHQGEDVVISIADTGAGIPEAIRHKVFNPFFTTKEVGKGTGQGLAIARSVVHEKHGGRLDCESEPGSGATFTILLPVAGFRSVPRAAA